MKRFLIIIFLVCFSFPASASSKVLHRKSAWEGMYGYFSGAGGQTLKNDAYDGEHAHVAYSFASGMGIPFLRLEAEFLTIDRRTEDADNARRLHAVFSNVLVGEIVYGGIGWGRGDWGDKTTDVYQLIGGAEIPLGPYVRVGAEYHYIHSRNEPDDVLKPFKAEVVMARLRVNF